MSEWIGIREAAERLSVHENTVRNYIARGYLPAMTLPSGVRRLRAVDVAQLLPATARTNVRGHVVEDDVLP